MEGCKIAMLPWISGDLYAGVHRDTYGVDSDGEEVMRIVNEVLNMRAFDKDGRDNFGTFFPRRHIITLEYGKKTVDTKILGKKKSADAPGVSSKKQKQSPIKFMAYNILANAQVDRKLMEDDWLGKIKQNPWNMKKKILYESQLRQTRQNLETSFGTWPDRSDRADVQRHLHQLKEYDGVLIHKNGGFGDNSAIVWKKRDSKKWDTRCAKWAVRRFSRRRVERYTHTACVCSRGPPFKSGRVRSREDATEPIGKGTGIAKVSFWRLTMCYVRGFQLRQYASQDEELVRTHGKDEMDQCFSKQYTLISMGLFSTTSIFIACHLQTREFCTARRVGSLSVDGRAVSLNFDIRGNGTHQRS